MCAWSGRSAEPQTGSLLHKLAGLSCNWYFVLRVQCKISDTGRWSIVLTAAQFSCAGWSYVEDCVCLCLQSCLWRFSRAGNVLHCCHIKFPATTCSETSSHTCFDSVGTHLDSSSTLAKMSAEPLSCSFSRSISVEHRRKCQSYLTSCCRCKKAALWLSMSVPA